MAGLSQAKFEMTARVGTRRLRRGRLFNLQVLRFLAALLVAAEHISESYGLHGGTLPLWWVSYVSPVGVDIFFVLSGFIIHQTTLDLSGPEDALRFLWRRAARIYLPFWAACLLFVIILTLFGVPQWLAHVDWPKALLLLPLPYPNMLFAVAWTLSYEVQFYALCAVTVVFSRQRFWIFGIAALGSGALAAYTVVEQTSYPTLFAAGANAMALEFLFGVSISAIITRRGTANSVRWIVIAVAVIASTAAVWATFRLPLGGPTAFLVRTVTFGLGATMLVYGAVGLDAVFKPPRILIFMGDASYSIYLTHIIAVALIWFLLPIEGISYFQGHPDIAWLSALALALAGAVTFHILAERPLLRAANACGRLIALPSSLHPNVRATPLADPV